MLLLIVTLNYYQKQSIADVGLSSVALIFLKAFIYE